MSRFFSPDFLLGGLLSASLLAMLGGYLFDVDWITETGVVVFRFVVLAVLLVALVVGIVMWLTRDTHDTAETPDDNDP